MDHGQDGVQRTYCRICDAQCGLLATVEGGTVTKLAPDRENPHSRGRVCIKGTSFLDVTNDPDRVLRPLKRTGGPGQFEEVTWDEALSDIAARLQAILAQDGPEALASYMGNPSAYSSLNMLYANGFLAACGSDKFYSAGSQDANAQMRANELLFGSPFPFPIPDIPHTDLLFVFGSNPLVSNGSIVVTPRVREDLDAIHSRGRVVVFDPRKTETAAAYDHVSIKPGGDPWLLLAMIRHAVESGNVDQDFIRRRTSGFDRLVERILQVDMDLASDRSGVPVETIRRLAQEFADTPNAATYGRVGIGRNPFATLSNALHHIFSVIHGRFGRRGTMGFGQHLHPAPENAADAAGGPVRTRIGGLRAVAGHLSAPVMAADMTEPGPGRVRAFYVMSGNPVISAPNGAELETALAGLDLFFSLDLYVNETNRHAHYILPCTTWLEREDVNIAHIDLMIRPHMQATRAVVPAMGEAREEYDIFWDLCDRMGLTTPLPMIPLPDGLRTGPKSSRHRGTVDLMVRTSRFGDQLGQRPDGLTLDKLFDDHGGICPLPVDDVLAGTFGRISHQDGRIHLCGDDIDGEISRLLSTADHAAPRFRLIGRRDIRTINSWMHNSRRLARSLDPRLLIHPEDAREIGVESGGKVRISTSDAVPLTVIVEVTDGVRRGVVCYPHGYGHGSGGWKTANRIDAVNINQLAPTNLESIEVQSGSAYLDGFPVSIEPVPEQA